MSPEFETHRGPSSILDQKVHFSITCCLRFNICHRSDTQVPPKWHKVKEIGKLVKLVLVSIQKCYAVGRAYNSVGRAKDF